jgi:ribosome biogenesis GTPase A
MFFPTEILTLSTMLATVLAFRPPQRTFRQSHRLVLSSTMASDTEYARPVVQWYPGHIAKAERSLAETLKAVDVVVEVRDSRIPKATSHPMISQWTAGTPRIVVLTHGDVVPGAAKAEWMAALPRFGWNHPDHVVDLQVQNQAKQAQAERLKYNTNSNAADDTPLNPVLFVNAKQGTGISALVRSTIKAGAHVQERRNRRGLKERPLRVGVIGYPNVGKSALINKLIGRKRAKTANTPGVTRSLQWIRVKTDKKQSFELLDSPGIIPASLVDQSDAVLLAACNCIGEAAYDNQAVASFLCEWLLTMYRHDNGVIARQYAPKWRSQCIERYKFDPLSATTRQMDGGSPRTGEDILFDVADETCQGNPEDASRKILQDFRAGRLGPICLQVAPRSDSDRGQRSLGGVMDGVSDVELMREKMQVQLAAERAERARAAQDTARERGLALPSVIQDRQTSQGSSQDDSQVGKGVFDGW